MTDTRSCSQCGATYRSNLDYCGLDGAELADVGEDALVGRTVDRYQVLEVLGDGGMARVYRAKHTFLNRECALKILFGEHAKDDRFNLRFRNEAFSASQIDHPNVVQVHDFGVTANHLPFMAMELIEGCTLAERLFFGPAPSPDEIRSIGQQIAAGLDAVHTRGFIHRDLKPGNVMLCAGDLDDLKILDFGLVCDTEADERAHLTQDGRIVGTPSYMAPEQITGGELTPRTDLYALGVVLYELITGAPPFTGPVREILGGHVGATPPPLPERGILKPVVERLLAKDPTDRPRDARHVRELLDNGSISVPTVSERAPRPLPPVQASERSRGRQGDDPVELELIRRDLRGSHARLLVTLAAVAVAVISLLSLLPAGSRPSARVAASPPSRVSSVKASEVRRRPREVNTPPNPTPRRPPATRGATPEAPPVRRAVPRDAPPPDSQTSVRG